MEMIRRDVLKGLNPKQVKAVSHTEGALLVVAGAGSGKTRVITHRIANIIQEKGVRPDEILAITFTNKAAGEMKERVQQLLGVETPWISTFHSVGLRILKYEKEHLGFASDFTIMDVDDPKKMMKAIIKELKYNEKEVDYRTALYQISGWKNLLLEPEDVYTNNDADELILNIYKYYRDICKEQSLLDFDDLLLLPVKLFEKNPDVLQKYRERFPYILVDEYQDTNAAQYKFITMLGEHGNICATGDPDQGIYGWRGADITNILKFGKDFENCETIVLEENYRSTARILRAAQSVVENNQERYEKSIFTNAAQGEKIKVITVDDEKDEARAIAIRCQTLHESEGISYGDCAVFYRTNVQSRVIEDEFVHRGIPYVLVGGTRFYDRAEVKDVVAFLKLVTNPRDAMSLERVVTNIIKGVGKGALDKIKQFAYSKQVAVYDVLMDDVFLSQVAVGRGKKGIKGLSILWRKLMHLPLHDPERCVEEVLSIADLERHYLNKNPDEKGEEKVKNIKELITIARERESLIDFLDHIALFSSADLGSKDKNQVMLMTLHASKGLEFPIVFISGCEQGLLPHARGGRVSSDKELEEERRLMYVGITRAMKELYVTLATRRFQAGQVMSNAPSQFLAEIPDSCIEHKAVIGRTLPDNTTEITHGPNYPKDSVASFIMGDVNIDKDGNIDGAEAIKKLKESGLLSQGRAFKDAMRGSDKANSMMKQNFEPIILPGDLYMPGDKITHKKYGAGEVLRMTGPRHNREIEIKFKTNEVKKMLLKFAGKLISSI